MTVRGRQRARGKLESIVVLVAWGLLGLGPGCLGGWTGSNDEASGLGCFDRTLDYSESSTQGVSAEEMLATHGGTHQGASVNVEEGFWGLAGFEPVDSALPLELSIAYAGGPIVERDSCQSLAVTVELSVKLGNGLAAWQLPAELVSTAGRIHLGIVLPPVDGATAVGIELSVALGDPSSTAVLRAFNDSSEATATFELD